ncbi:MAG: VCBS repeat-containing protein [Ignavibacteria bacterium]|nr:VCBS repeat-containing protein [Ignavibacteria bacterium]
MKILLSLLVVAFLGSISIYAQKPVQDLPELQEWYSWPGALGSNISYLPGFSAQGGMNAVTQLRSGDPTWFNQFAYDTVSRFQWKELGSHYVVSVDFNNDGIPDYMDTRGRIYTGLKKGEMPNPEPVQTLSRGSFLWASVGDFNGDGYQDIFAPNSGKDFEIIFGGKDITKIRRTILSMPPYSMSDQWQMISAYVNEEGNGRLISSRRSDFSEGFYLYGLTFETTPNDSVVVNLKVLSAIEVLKQTNDQQIFEKYVYSFYQSKVKKEYSLIIHTAQVGSNPGESRGYAVEQDKFRYVATMLQQQCPLAAFREVLTETVWKIL